MNQLPPLTYSANYQPCAGCQPPVSNFQTHTKITLHCKDTALFVTKSAEFGNINWKMSRYLNMYIQALAVE